ncbi:sugar phosphate isomerase/epimerase [Clostridium sp. SYSU_GA19001]|uniref:sugar phosphate isomerase/epimerase family protein n=1 Tax=Clostridium caldaquaticum TaxID=2940653 RepID=UPI002076FA47|nr:TIM barrel protein [Clostridium caldaquaticum]MCM8709977.1 sugar phosphate isomerase/epimerase [Clostridium caldaquaticum]
MDNNLKKTGKPKRGVSIYSYQGEYGVTMNLEDMLAEMQDMGARGLEILGNSHVEGYPNPSEEWLENWDKLIEKYDIIPVEYGHWVDSRLYKGRELTTKESYDMLVRDFKIANRLGFTILRTKLGVIDDNLTPVSNWREFIKMALPLAEEYNVRMCPEIHAPTVLKSKIVDDYIEFIEQTGTKYFGLNIDFSVFQTGSLLPGEIGPDGFVMPPCDHSPVEDIIPLLPYVYCCHAKFLKMSEDFKEMTIPYEEIVNTLIKNNWDGYLLSEYEGPKARITGGASEQLRRHHIMLKRLLGE